MGWLSAETEKALGYLQRFDHKEEPPSDDDSSTSSTSTQTTDSSVTMRPANLYQDPHHIYYRHLLEDDLARWKFNTAKRWKISIRLDGRFPRLAVNSYEFCPWETRVSAFNDDWSTGPLSFMHHWNHHLRCLGASTHLTPLDARESCLLVSSQCESVVKPGLYHKPSLVTKAVRFGNVSIHDVDVPLETFESQRSFRKSADGASKLFPKEKRGKWTEETIETELERLLEKEEKRKYCKFSFGYLFFCNKYVWNREQ